MTEFETAQNINLSPLALRIELHAVCVKIERNLGLQLLRNWINETLRSFDVKETNSFMEKSMLEYRPLNVQQHEWNDINKRTKRNSNSVQCTDSAIIAPIDSLEAVYTDEIVLQYGDDIVTEDALTNRVQDDEVISLHNHELEHIEYCESRFIDISDQTDSYDGQNITFVDSNNVGANLEITQDNACFDVRVVTLNSDVDEPFEFVEYKNRKSVDIDNCVETTICVVEPVCKPSSCLLEHTKVESVDDDSFENTQIANVNDHELYSSSNTSGELITMNRQCNICFKTCSNKSNLKTHMKIHYKERPFVCKECGKNFRIVHNLHLHQRTHTGERHHVCTTCGKAFAWPESLKRHQSTHSNERLYSCAHCDKNFSHNQHLIRHLKVVHMKDECKFMCTQCGKNCSSTYDLRIHEAWCRGERPYICSYCDKKFAAARNLKQHERVHTGERPYACTICDKRFQLSSYVKVHIRQVHSDERPYQCMKCDMSFAVKRVLTRHLLVHSGERPFGCNYCEKKLSSAFALKTHEQKHLQTLSSVVDNVTHSMKFSIVGGLNQDGSR